MVTSQEARDAMQLAPASGSPALGSIDQFLLDIQGVGFSASQTNLANIWTIVLNIEAELSILSSQVSTLSDQLDAIQVGSGDVPIDTADLTFWVRGDAYDGIVRAKKRWTVTSIYDLTSTPGTLRISPAKDGGTIVSTDVSVVSLGGDQYQIDAGATTLQTYELIAGSNAFLHVRFDAVDFTPVRARAVVYKNLVELP